MNYGTTEKQAAAAIAQLQAAGLPATRTAAGRHFLWVHCPAAFPLGAGRVAVPSVSGFIARFGGAL